MKPQTQSLLIASVFVGAVFAYPLLASLLSIASVPESATPSIVLRTAVAFLALLALFFGRERLREVDATLLIPFAVFWTMYVGRIVADGYFLQVPMNIPATQLIVYSITFSLVPALAGMLALDEKSAAVTFRLLVIVGLVAFAVIAVDSRTVLVQLQESGITRFALEKLNPISVANVGGSLVLLGVVGVFAVRGLALLPRLFFVGVVSVGLVTLVFGASRGPMLATLAGVLLFALLNVSPKRLFLVIVVLGVVAAVGFQAYRFGEQNFAFDVVERIRLASEGLDDSANTRTEQWSNAWAQFVDSPLYGDAISERSTGYYPHNTVLEALMATGLLGGAAYLFLIAMSLMAALRSLLRRDGGEWLGLLSLQYLIASQFTGAHYINGAHWLTMVAVIATDARVRKRRRSRRRTRRRIVPGERPPSRGRVPV